MTKNRYHAVIGLEVHVQLGSRTKIFCSCATVFGQTPNSQVCPVCAGLPGVLPVLNRQVFELGIRAVLALEGKVSRTVRFDRKNYFYPDLPKGYQISQFRHPLGEGGFVEIDLPDGSSRKIGLTRLHLEEDAGKLIHEGSGGTSLVDLNRAGVPLAEIVSEPELRSPEEAHAYLTNLRAILKAAGVSDVDMEKGQLRCDANVSIRRGEQDPFGTRAEIKNLNSFKNVRAAIEYEIKRQAEVLDLGEKVIQETRLFDAAAGETRSMRSKEEAHDYRYFPEPDLVPFEVDDAWVAAVRSALPELPAAKKKRFQDRYGLGAYDVGVLLQDEALAALFEELAARYNIHKNLANWLIGPLTANLNERGIGLEQAVFSREGFLRMLELVDRGEVSYKACKEEIFPIFMQKNLPPDQILEEKGLRQISDTSALDKAADAAIAANPKSASDFKSGKANALMFLVGQVMKATQGKANPNLVKELLEKKLA